MSIKTTIKDDALEFLARGVGRSVIQPVIDEANEDIARGARRRVHVITGKTRASIRREGNSVVAEVGALYEEFGTRYRPPHPFLRPAFSEVAAELPDRVARALTKAITGHGGSGSGR